MKMGKFEKLFVNSPSHSQQVSQHAEKLLNLIDFKAGQKYLDVGCGNGAAPIYLAQKYQIGRNWHRCGPGSDSTGRSTKSRAK